MKNSLVRLVFILDDLLALGTNREAVLAFVDSDCAHSHGQTAYKREQQTEDFELKRG